MLRNELRRPGWAVGVVLIAMLWLATPAVVPGQEPAKIESNQVEPAKAAATPAESPASAPATTKTEAAKTDAKPAAPPAAANQVVPTEESTGYLIPMLVFAGVVVGSGVLGTMWARAARLDDQGFRLGAIVFAVSMSALIAFVYWPPKLGIDLSGGFVLNYRIDRSQTEGSFSMDDLVGAITKRVNPGGTKEVTVRPYGSDEIEIIIPDATQEELVAIKEMITKLGSLEFKITANDRDHASIIAQARATTDNQIFAKSGEGEAPKLVASWVPLHKDAEPDQANDPNLITRVTAQGIAQVLVINDDLKVTGENLLSAERGVDRLGNPTVDFRFDAVGTNRFSQLTERNLPDGNFHRRLAILLDGAFYNAPNIITTIYDRGQITNMSDEKKVQAQVEVLKAGRLPAALYHEPTSELYIGPTLGKDTVEKGVRSMLVGTGAVVLFMLVYYRFAGIVANIAVVLNVLITVALMMIFQAAFTLSGLAGLALTVGMAVDANVLIYERMREELARGATLRMAIRNGFDRATTTIIDANVTTLIAGVVLYWIGSDQVKGFAVTLIIGLLANLFTAITVSRAIFDTAEKRRTITTLRMMQLLAATKIDFLGKRRLAVAASLIVIGIGLAACIKRGKGLLDIDFTGGTSVQVLFKESKDIRQVREAVNDLPDVTVQDVKLADEPAGKRYLIVTSKPNTVSEEKDGHLFVIEEDVVEKELYQIFKGQLVANELTIGEVKPLGKPAAKQGAAFERGADRLLAWAPAAPLALLAAEPEPATKDDTPKNVDPAKPAEPPKSAPPATKEPAKTESPKTEPPKAEPPKAAPPKSEPAKTTEPTKTEPTKTEPAKAAPAPAVPAPPAPATTPTPPATTPPATTTPAKTDVAPVDPYENGAQTTLTFTEPIGQQVLTDLVNEQLKKIGKENTAFELFDPQQQQGATSAYGQWSLKIALPPADATKLLNSLKAKLLDEPFFPASSQVGAAVAGTTQQQALAAIAVSLALILAYVWFRFAQVTFGIAAVVAVIHDVLVALGALGLSLWLAGPLGFLGVDQFKINLPIIAAFLTIIGYSLNDTIVIFDRIREIRGKSTTITPELVNLSLNQTLGRTLLTSMTVFITVLILYVLGGQGIHGFAFALVIGTIAGTYSTIYIATPMVLWLQDWTGGAKQSPAKMAQRAAL